MLKYKQLKSRIMEGIKIMKFLNIILLICCLTNIMNASSAKAAAAQETCDHIQKKFIEHEQHNLDAMNKYVSTLDSQSKKKHSYLLLENPLVLIKGYCTATAFGISTLCKDKPSSTINRYKQLCLLAANDEARTAVLKAGMEANSQK